MNPEDQEDQMQEEYTGEEMTLTEHLAEMRNRLIKAMLGVVVGMGISFIFVRQIYQLIRDLLPKGAATPQALSPLEPFTIYIKIALLSGIAIALPIVIYQGIAFISPGLTRKERRYTLAALPIVAIFFAGGVAFGYFIVLRNALNFLLGLAGQQIEVQLRVTDFINFVIRFLFAMGLVFLTPFVVYTITKLRIVTPRQLMQYRKYVALGILVIAAVLTPTPDPVNLMIVAVPMYLLYEVGIVFGRIF